MTFAQAPEPAHDAEFLNRLRLPRVPRSDDATWRPKRTARPTIVPIRDERDAYVERLERSIEELTSRLAELEVTVDEVTDTLEGLQEDLPPARWRIPIQARKAR